MRGVVSAGMVCALEQLGLLNVFDAIYGASAGAAIASYFAAGQATYATSIYYENVNNRHFISLLRPFVGKPLISFNYLIDHVGIYEKILDCDAAIKSNVSLNLIATSLDAGHTKALTGFRDRAELIEALRASLRIPIFGGPPVLFRGERFVDGSLLEPVPMSAALDDGCTHVLALVSNHGGYPNLVLRVLDRFVVAPYLSRFRRELAENYLRRRRALDDSRGTCPGGGADPIMAEVCRIELAVESAIVGRLETSRYRLIAGAKAGMQRAFEVLTGTKPQLVEVIQAYTKKPKA